MDEFWVCQHCKSLNRFGSGKCYGCKNKYGSKPKEVGTLARSAGAPMPLPPAAPAVPGAIPATPPYLRRPVAVGPVLGAAKVSASGGLYRPHPIAALRQRVALWFALRPSLPVAWLGYLTAALLALVVLGGAMLLMNVTPAISYLIQYANASEAWGQLTTAQQGTVQTLGVALAILGTISLLCFSLFLGLSTHNATGLGADQPLLTPYRAGLSWASALWAQARIAVGLIVPAMIIWDGYTIPGLIAMIVAVEIAQRHMEDPLGWLTRPARHLPDLYAKLGVEGSIASPLAILWSVTFRIANLLVVAIAAVPAIGLLVHAGSNLAGQSEVVGWQSGGFGLLQIGIALLVGSLAGLTFGSLAMLVPITLGLVQRQRTRRTLVRVGRSRSWVARPGEGGYATVGGSRGDPYGDDPDDRIVERVPRYSDQEDSGLGGVAASQPFGGFGGPSAPGGAALTPGFGNFGGTAGPEPFSGPGDPAPRGPFGGLGGASQNRGFSGPSAGLPQGVPEPGPRSADTDPDSELIG